MDIETKTRFEALEIALIAAMNAVPGFNAETYRGILEKQRKNIRDNNPDSALAREIDRMLEARHR